MRIVVLCSFDLGRINEEFVDDSGRAYKAMAKFYSSTSFVTDVFNVFILIAGGLFLYSGRICYNDMKRIRMRSDCSGHDGA